MQPTFGLTAAAMLLGAVSGDYGGYYGPLRTRPKVKVRPQPDKRAKVKAARKARLRNA